MDWIKLLEVDERVLDMPILLMCVSGLSNKTIADEYRISEEEISDIISRNLKFGGWIEDLNFSPWFYYKNNKAIEPSLSYVCGLICKRYYELGKELEFYE